MFEDADFLNQINIGIGIHEIKVSSFEIKSSLIMKSSK